VGELLMGDVSCDGGGEGGKGEERVAGKSSSPSKE